MPARHHIILQGNLNHCARAQDLLVQAMAEWGVAVAAVAEPYFVPPRGNWAGDQEETVAIVASTAGNSPPLVVKERGSGFVAARWMRSHPNWGVLLSKPLPGPIPGIPGDPREGGEEGSSDTGVGVGGPQRQERCVGFSGHQCQRARVGGLGGSLRAGRPQPRPCQHVLEDEETLSDHKYIRMRVSHTPPTTASNTAPGRGFPKWALTRLDLELAEEAAMVQAWCPPLPATVDVEQRAVKFREDLTAVCERAMPRVRGTPGKKSVYWWTAEIGDLRTARCEAGPEGRNRTGQGLERRVRAKEEFLATLDADPWGRPYKVVRNKMYGASPMDSLELDLLNRVVEGLFPEPQPFTPPAM
ncbi:uncharacterized protein LOC113237709, partial [Hyposmocoma kahamanoa]|uniref:uncharacterized protein LOC113237709 n=1 Tax=Hyposmocoma kahamanoa TaxID=1477025 RepID=UPI000E6D5F1C